MRTPLIAGNWKLNKTIAQAEAFVAELKPLVADVENVEILICPVATTLAVLREQVAGSNIMLGAQNMFWKNSGAYTGEVSSELLKDAGCSHVIIGHSERRGRFGVPEADLEGEAGLVFGDNDYSVQHKVTAALENDLTPIVCVGETLTDAGMDTPIPLFKTKRQWRCKTLALRMAKRSFLPMSRCGRLAPEKPALLKKPIAFVE